MSIVTVCGSSRECVLLTVAKVKSVTWHSLSLSRTERSRRTKIATEVAHVTGDSDTTFKVKGQLADVLNSQHTRTGATWRINTKILSICRGRRHIVLPRAQLVSSIIIIIIIIIIVNL